MQNFLNKIGLLLLGIIGGKNATGQSYTVLTGSNNPLGDFDFLSDVRPAAADVDNDGDIDIISGACEEPGLKFLRNDGNNNFTDVQGVNNPFNGIAACSSPEFVDFDNDGDLDLFIGSYYIDKYARLTLFINDGDGNFQENINNPFLETNFNLFANTAFTDLDDDGDLDALIAEDYALKIFKNNGDNTFEEIDVNTTGFASISAFQNLTPEAVDFDNDGDEDLVFGSKYGSLIAFEKNGADDFTELINTSNPLQNITSVVSPFPSFLDFDGDTDLDLIIGRANGMFDFYENTEITIGIDDFAIDMNIYPNPAKDFIRIEGIQKIEDINIYNLQGQLLLNKVFFDQNYIIDTHNLLTGIYLMEIRSEGPKKCIKFLKD